MKRSSFDRSGRGEICHASQEPRDGWEIEIEQLIDSSKQQHLSVK
jgi:hypothetical protein